MKTPALLSVEQQEAITAIYEKNKLLIAPMGQGKTIIAATAITELINSGVVKRVLIITTKQIAQSVWSREFLEWTHTKHVRVSAACGTPEQRLTIINDLNIQVVVITFGTTKWLVDNRLYKLFDGLLIDETTKIKNTSSQVVKSLKKKRVADTFKWVCGLSATPVAENLSDIFSQLRIIDKGASLGTSYQKFSYEYFNVRQHGFIVKLTPRADSVSRILNKAKDALYIMKDNRLATLPGITYNKIMIDMPAELRVKYDQFKKIKKIDSYVAMTAGALHQKLQQLACGFIYDDDKQVISYTNHREEALLALLNTIDKSENIIITYNYLEDEARLRAVLPGAVLLNSTNSKTAIAAWNSGGIKYLLISPRSAGFGIHLEKGGRHLVWYSPQYSNDVYQQANSRIWRTNQKKKVFIHEIVTKNSIDTHIVDIVRAKEKIDLQFNKKALDIV